MKQLTKDFLQNLLSVFWNHWQISAPNKNFPDLWNNSSCFTVLDSHSKLDELNSEAIYSTCGTVVIFKSVGHFATDILRKANKTSRLYFRKHKINHSSIYDSENTMDIIKYSKFYNSTLNIINMSLLLLCIA